MLKVNEAWIKRVETVYPGIGQQISDFDKATLPACPHCGSEDAADVQCGIIGRTIHIASATTKFKLLANGPKPGKYFCNACRRYFDKRRRKKAVKSRLGVAFAKPGCAAATCPA